MEKEILIIAAALVLAIILITVIIVVSIKRRKFNTKYNEVKPKLDAWINSAKTSGYNYTHMATLLQLHDWDKKIVERALKDNGLEKPPYYDQTLKKAKKKVKSKL